MNNLEDIIEIFISIVAKRDLEIARLTKDNNYWMEKYYDKNSELGNLKDSLNVKNPLE